VTQVGIFELFSYWNRLRGERAAPKRSEIEPMDIRLYLADTFILENHPRDAASFRLAGTRVCAIFGRELKNISFYSLFCAEDLKILKCLLLSCFNEKTASILSFEGTSRSKVSLDFECVLLPLDNDSNSERLFGAIIAKQKPFWLGADIIVNCRLTSLKVINPISDMNITLQKSVSSSYTHPPLNPFLIPLKRHEALFQPLGKRMGHLTVIEGGLSQSTR
jgi:hypothetical protein